MDGQHQLLFQQVLGRLVALGVLDDLHQAAFVEVGEIGDVAATYAFDAKQARAIMRANKIDKPQSGRWEWETVPKAVYDAFKNFKK